MALLFTAPLSLAQLAVQAPQWGRNAFARLNALMPKRKQDSVVQDAAKPTKTRKPKSLRAVIEEVLPTAEDNPSAEVFSVTPPTVVLPEPRELLNRSRMRPSSAKSRTPATINCRMRMNY